MARNMYYIQEKDHCGVHESAYSIQMVLVVVFEIIQ
jgi:hypothetical protein